MILLLENVSGLGVLVNLTIGVVMLAFALSANVRFWGMFHVEHKKYVRFGGCANFHLRGGWLRG